MARAKLWARRGMPRLYQLAWLTKRSILYRGSSFRCVVCDRSMRRWKRESRVPGEAVCPWCESRGRQRLMWLWISRETDLFSKPRRLLHLAPEKGLQQRFLRADNLSYVPVDLDSPLAAVTMDLCACPLPDDSFDAILCTHVLEHIPDDRSAMSELERILRPGGWALLMVPFLPDRRTEEDPGATREERLRRFDQEDHVRKYGGDYIDRLNKAELCVNFEVYATRFEPRFIHEHGLPMEFLIVGWKPMAIILEPNALEPPRQRTDAGSSLKMPSRPQVSSSRARLGSFTV
jgi:SAM-dependent methyltransferase